MQSLTSTSFVHLSIPIELAWSPRHSIQESQGDWLPLAHILCVWVSRLLARLGPERAPLQLWSGAQHEGGHNMVSLLQ